MPITIQQIFSNFGITEIKKVKWGIAINEEQEGVYIVSTSNSQFENNGCLPQPEFNDSQLTKWIQKLPDFEIDSNKVTEDSIKKRLSQFWLPDESILYIGKAPLRKKGGGIGNRVKEYYKTDIGNKSPHSGGQWIKCLKNLDNLYVYYATCDNSDYIERKMLYYFMQNVSVETLDLLYDKNMPLPFANLRLNTELI